MQLVVCQSVSLSGNFSGIDKPFILFVFLFAEYISLDKTEKVATNSISMTGSKGSKFNCHKQDYTVQFSSFEPIYFTSVQKLS